MLDLLQSWLQIRVGGFLLTGSAGKMRISTWLGSVSAPTACKAEVVMEVGALR